MKKLTVSVLLLCTVVLAFSAGRIEEIADSAVYDAISEVILENGSIFSVDVVSHDMDTVYVEYSAPENAPFTLAAENTGHRLFLDVEKDFHFGPVPGGEYKITIKVPSDCSVEVNSATGAVSVENVNGGLFVDTNTGSVKVKNCSGNIGLFSNTGTVYADSLEGELEVDLDTGNLNLSSFYGQIKAATRIGSINAVDVYLKKNSKFESGIGRIHIALLNRPEDLTIDARSKLGRIEIFGKKTSKNLKKGSGPVKLTAATDTGSITIN